MTRVYVVTAAGVRAGTLSPNRNRRRGPETAERISDGRRELRIVLERHLQLRGQTIVLFSPARWFDAAVVHDRKVDASRAFTKAARTAGTRTLVAAAIAQRAVQLS